MATRVELHNELLEILGSNNVYYQPPESVKINYPAIVYFLSSVRQVKADDKDYRRLRSYDVTLIDKNPESGYFDVILDRFTYVRYDRHFVADNLHHFIFTIYY